MKNAKISYKTLRKKYPRFIYQKFFYEIKTGDLKISFVFKIERSPPLQGCGGKSDIYFYPEIIIKKIDKSRIERLGKPALNNLIFHLGLIEMLSYWKATCSPEILIETGFLNKEQIKWWKNLIINGMGQFFYENKIDWRNPDFLTITNSSSVKINLAKTVFAPLGPAVSENKRYLVPIGGGRDSILTLELLKKRKKEINCFLVNPTESGKKVVRVAGIKNPVIVERSIDPKLLELNKRGYLNGHTPFTALLSFLSVFCAVLFDCKNVAFSNEKSANEGNVKYLGKIINHQYSKSSDFEKQFKYYCKKYLARDINYFSFLRRYGELEISKMFIQYPQYFPVFSSCNVSLKKGGKWCRKCPKCLSVYMTLYPFLENKKLSKIFRKDLYENKNLLSLMKDLLGRGKEKPFECVGTFKESRLAFKFSRQKAKKSGKIPYLLTKVK